MNLLTQNSKIKKTSKKLEVRLFNFGIPAYKSASGKITCPFAGDCVKFCYAKKALTSGQTLSQHSRSDTSLLKQMTLLIK